MSIEYRWKVYCITEGLDRYEWINETEGTPTRCFVNITTDDVIDPLQTEIVSSRAVYPPGPTGPVGISNLQNTESTGVSTTTNTTYVEKLTMTTDNLSLGTYRIGYSCEVQNNHINGGNVRVELDNTTELGSVYTDKTNSGYYNYSGFKYYTGSGVHTIDIDYQANSGTTSIRRARLEIWKIG